MTARRFTRVLCATNPEGSAEAARRLVELARSREADALAVVGGLGAAGPDAMRAVFRSLGTADLPTYWVPGPSDAPAADYLREAYNAEVAFPSLHGVHGTVAFSPGRHVIFAGLGGEVSDDPDEPREETERLRYPRWEAEYRLKVLRELGDHQLVLLFATPPLHKREDGSGSEAVAELALTYRARLVVCGGSPSVRTLGRTQVVSPGDLGDGHYAMADLHTGEAELEHALPEHADRR
jgi:uncharacterized protein